MTTLYSEHVSFTLVVPAAHLLVGEDVVVSVKDINQPNLLTPSCSVLVSIFVFMALSTVFHSTNSPDNSPFLVFFRSYFCLIGPFNYVPLYESLAQPWSNPLWLTGLKAATDSHWSERSIYPTPFEETSFHKTRFVQQKKTRKKKKTKKQIKA